MGQGLLPKEQPRTILTKETDLYKLEIHSFPRTNDGRIFVGYFHQEMFMTSIQKYESAFEESHKCRHILINMSLYINSYHAQLIAYV